eukprot:3773075-Ditylum_brightwellii.AAC.1
MVDDLLNNVLPAAGGIEGKEKVVGAMSSARKAKSLVGRWLEKTANNNPSPKDYSILCDSVIVGRDVIVLVNVKVKVVHLLQILLVISVPWTSMKYIITSGSCQSQNCHSKSGKGREALQVE